MKDLTFTITEEKLKNAIDLAVSEVFKNTYSNPFVDAIKEVIMDNKDVFKTTFSQILSDLMSSDDFKKELGNIAMKQLVENSFKN